MTTLWWWLIILSHLFAPAQPFTLPCDVDSCVENFSLSGDTKQFCIGTRSALACVDQIKKDFNCTNFDRWRVVDVSFRLYRMSVCVCSRGSTRIYSVAVSLGLATMAFIVTRVK